MNPAQLLSRVALFVALLLPAGASAQTPSPDQARPASAERFLVIVETSAPMQKRAENAQKILGSVISSGLGGRMHAGSTIGMWTFNDKLQTGQLPLQVWTPAARQRVALTMVQSLQQQKYEKPPRLAAAWEVATNVIAQSGHITVLLITSGSNALVGTPFDAPIAETYSKNADAQRKNNMPFLTILRAVDGKIVNFAVNMPPWPLEVPEYPDGFKPVPPPPPAVTQAVTNPPAPVVKRPDRPNLSPTNTIFLTETPPPVAELLPLPPPKPEPTDPVVTPAQPSSPAANVATPVAAVLAAETNPPPPAAARVEKVLPPIDPAVATKKFPIVTILLAGIALMLAVLVVFLALLRWSRRSAGASLITRSMNQNDR